jgi:hypothetical protein
MLTTINYIKKQVVLRLTQRQQKGYKAINVIVDRFFIKGVLRMKRTIIALLTLTTIACAPSAFGMLQQPSSASINSSASCSASSSSSSTRSSTPTSSSSSSAATKHSSRSSIDDMQLATNWSIKRRIHKAKFKQEILAIKYMASEAYAETLRRQDPEKKHLTALEARFIALDEAEFLALMLEASIREIEQRETGPLSREIEEALFQIKEAREQAKQEEREQREQAEQKQREQDALEPRYYGLYEVDSRFYRFSASESEMCRQCESAFRKLWF